MTKGQLSLMILFLLSLHAYGQVPTEKLKIRWPEEYKWKTVADYESGYVHTVQFTPEDERMNKRILVSTTKIWGAKHVSMDSAITRLFNEIKQKSPEATLTVLEDSAGVKNYWTIFKIESPRNKLDKKARSELHYLIQGQSSLFVSHVSIEEKTLSSSFIEKWKLVFKTSQLVWE